MSKYYAKSNNETSRELFMKRRMYRSEPQLQRRPVVNFSDGGEKFLYGRVSPRMLPMELTSKQSLGTIASDHCADAKTPQQAIHFVADAFNEMSTFFAQKVLAQNINIDDPYLSTLQAYKSFKPPTKLYADYSKVFHNATVTTLKKGQTPITNFPQFMDRMLQALEKGGPTFPFTKPAYIKSKICPIYCSGLAIEIADLKYDNDEDKKKFIESPNWEFFVEACNQYGFMIDLNIPWRIVADIDSAGMQQYSSRRGYSTTGAILGLYKNTQINYIPLFIANLYRLYEAVKRPQFDVTVCSTGEPLLKVQPPQSYNGIPGVIEEFKLEYFLNYYFRIRFAEEESQFTEAEQQRLIAETLQLYHQGNPVRAVNIFEQILNKTFDYAGSLSYIIERRKKADDDDLSIYRR